VSVHYETDGPVVIVTIDRLDVANAIDRPTAGQLVSAFERFDAEESSSVAVLTGADGKFSAGADLKAMQDRDPPVSRAWRRTATARWGRRACCSASR
jgi:enoyl-CoA hydratase